MVRGRRPIGVLIPDVVPHPRFGSTVVSTGLEISEADLRASFWGYRKATMFPQSAIKADVRAQSHESEDARPYYVDLLISCTACKRPFLFFAREQQYWYEELKFTVDARCVHCAQCRHSDHELARHKRGYDAGIGALDRGELDDTAFATLVDDAVHLWTGGVLRDAQRLRRLRNLARKRIPESAATIAIERVVGELSLHRPAR